MTAYLEAQLSTSRPALRGWSHALAVPAAVLFTGALAVRCLGDRPRLASMLVYGLSLIVIAINAPGMATNTSAIELMAMSIARLMTAFNPCSGTS